MRIDEFGDWVFDSIGDDDLQDDDSDDPDQLEFDEEWDDYDDNPDDDEYGDDDDDSGDVDTASEMDARDAGDVEPEWWEDGMPDDWWDYYGDDYEVDEFEIAIDY